MATKKPVKRTKKAAKKPAKMLAKKPAAKKVKAKKAKAKKAPARKSVKAKTAKKAKPKKAGKAKKAKKAKTTRGKKKVVKSRAKKAGKKPGKARAKKARAKPAAKSSTQLSTLASLNKAPVIANRQPSIVKPAVSSGAKQKIKDFLTTKNVKFEFVQHTPGFTAQQVAASAHIPGKQLAKTVIVKIDGKLAMIMEPAHLKVNLDAFRRQINAQKVELATEAEFRSKFQDCELGAMPPFGNLYGMDVFVSDNLAHADKIAFNAGTHSELVIMAYQDFFKLVQPKVIHS